MKRVLIVYNYTVVEPLGALFLSNYLQKEGHEIDIIDYQSLGDNFDFGKYDFIGFSILTGSHIPMFKVADKIKEKAKNTKIVMGGPHAISFFKDCKEHADFVVRGFGERIFLDIVNGKIKEEGVYSEKEPPKDLLIYDREKFYRDEKRRNNPLKNVITSFCCPFKCTYCYNSIVQEEFPAYKPTTRPVDSVIEECKILKKYPLKVIVFQDDTFGFDVKWLREFAKKYKEEINVPFHCNIRIDIATDERIRLLKEAGCISVTFAIESASDKIRKELLNRNMTNKQIFDGVKILNKYKLPFRTQQMLGLPETTIEDDLELLKLNCEIKPLIAWTAIFSPIRGTPIAEYCIEKGYYDGKNDDISDTLFNHSVLNFSEKRKKQIVVLNKLFAVLAHIPNGWEVAEELMDSDFDLEDFYKVTKNHLYDLMYNLEGKVAKQTRARGKNG